MTVDQDSEAYRILTFKSGIGVDGTEVNNIFTWEISDTSCVEMAVYENMRLAGNNFLVVKPKKAGFAVITAVTVTGDKFYMAIEVKEKTPSGDIVSGDNVIHKLNDFSDYQYVSAERNKDYLIIIPDYMGNVRQWIFDDEIPEYDYEGEIMVPGTYGYDYQVDNAELVVTEKRFAIVSVKNKLTDVAVAIRTDDFPEAYRKIAFNISHNPTEILPDGTYLIQNMYNEKYIQIDDNFVPESDEEVQIPSGTKTETWEFNASVYQMWNLRWLGNGYYRILSAKTGHALSIDSDEVTNDNAMVVLANVNYNIDTSANQQWRFELTENGTYRIINKATLMANDDLQMALAFGFTQGLNGTNVANRGEVFDNKDEWELHSTIVSGVPNEVYSNANHYCVPVALTHIVGYWREQLSDCELVFGQYGDVSDWSLERLATEIELSTNGDSSNEAIEQVMNDFRFVNTEVSANEGLKFETIPHSYELKELVKEIFNERPTMVNFECSGLYDHVGVCVGIEVINGDTYIYVCNAVNTFIKEYGFSLHMHMNFLHLN